MTIKRIVSFVLAFLLISALLSAQSIPPKAITSSTVVGIVPPTPLPIQKPCIMGTLAAYIALGAEGCTFNNAIYANFSYSGSVAASAVGTASITTAQIIVTPVPTGPIVGPYSPGLTFSAHWQAASGQTMVSTIHYTITPIVASTAARSGLLTLQLGQAQVFGIFGNVAVQEITNAGSLSVGEKCTEVCSIRQSDSLEFSPMQPLVVTDTVMLTGGMAGASLNSFTAGFNSCLQCAEPL